MKSTDLVDQSSLRDDLPDFDAGDTLKVHVRVVEGNRERVQVFEGVVISRRGSGIGESFTVRKLSFGVGVERTFPMHSPIIEKIERMARGDVRRAKLYYLRNLSGKKARIAERTDGRSYNDAQFESQPEITEPEVVAEPVAEAAPTPEPVSEAVPETVTETPVETAQEKPKDNTAPEVEVVAEEADKK